MIARKQYHNTTFIFIASFRTAVRKDAIIFFAYLSRNRNKNIGIDKRNFTTPLDGHDKSSIINFVFKELKKIKK